MVRCECSRCGYLIRATRKWIDIAVPKCPACNVEMTVDAPKDGDQ